MRIIENNSFSINIILALYLRHNTVCSKLSNYFNKILLQMKKKINKIGIIGLGYVGAPLACKLAGHYKVIGFDVNEQRAKELSKGDDKTLEIESRELMEVLEMKDNKGLLVSSNVDDLKDCDFYIISVPTPVKKNKMPNLFFLEDASKLVGGFLSVGDIVVYESTVYPGATEESCVPVLEEHSGLKLNKDFSVGYSPERINPGDKINTLENIRKIISASNNEALDSLEEVYGSIVQAELHRAPSIKVAEAAKIIENIQRDVNIALVNELAIVFKHMNIDTMDVINAAATKWNFIKYTPGLVGGHCIGVDPYYLIRKSLSAGYLPHIISGSRRLNEKMPEYIANRIIKQMNLKGSKVKNASFLILGYTFKENCPDTRNTKIINLYRYLEEYSQDIDIYDPWVDSETVVPIQKKLIENKKYDAIIFAVSHTCFEKLPLKNMLNENGIIYDIKSVLHKDLTDERL